MCRVEERAYGGFARQCRDLRPHRNIDEFVERDGPGPHETPTHDAVVYTYDENDRVKTKSTTRPDVVYVATADLEVLCL